MRKWLKQLLCPHRDLSINFHLEDMTRWRWTCHKCGKVRGLR